MCEQWYCGSCEGLSVPPEIDIYICVINVVNNLFNEYFSVFFCFLLVAYLMSLKNKLSSIK